MMCTSPPKCTELHPVVSLSCCHSEAYQGSWQGSILLSRSAHCTVRLTQDFFLSSTSGPHHLLPGGVQSFFCLKSLWTSLPPILAPPNPLPTATAIWILPDALLPDYVIPLHKNLQQLFTAWLTTLSVRRIIMKFFLMVTYFLSSYYVPGTKLSMLHAQSHYSKHFLMEFLKPTEKEKTGSYSLLNSKIQRALKYRSLSYIWC